MDTMHIMCELEEKKDMTLENAQIDRNVMSDLVHDGYVTTNMSDEELEQSRAEYNKPWPAMYDPYYIPDILEKEQYCLYQWLGDELDMRCKERGLVFRTKEEAIEVAKKMLEVVK